MTATIAGSAREVTILEVYRDDGPIARALGATLGSAIRVPSIVLVVAGTLPLLVLLAVNPVDASDGAVGATIAWLVLAGGVSSGRPQSDSLGWAAVPIIRLGEYGGVVWLAALAGGSGPAAAFALLAAVAFRHYDLVYRLRYQGTPPPRWVGNVAGGWEGRLIAGWVLLATDALPAGFFTLAAVLGAVFVGESIASWTRIQRDRAVVEYEDEEAEEE
jgi:Family of unknown function (DUF5941)